MKISQALVKLVELQAKYGDLEIVDPDGDLMEFSYVPTDSNLEFPYPVVLGDWKEYEED